jgi:serine phosphatase RsbU (regulator of sigma subunit)
VLHAQENYNIDSSLAALKLQKEDSNKVNLLLNLGGAYQSVGELKKSLDYNTSGMELAVKLGYKKGEASAHMNLGLIDENKGNYEKAVAHFIKSLKIFEELNEKKSISYCYNNLGMVYYNQQNYKKGEECYLKAIALGNNELTTMENLALLYYETKQYQKSLKYHQMALKGFEDMKYEVGIADVNANMGLVYFDMAEYEKALATDLRSLETYLQISDKRRLNITYENIGGVYVKLKKYDKALFYINEALKLANEIGDKEGIRSCYMGLYELSNGQKNYTAAYEYLVKYSAITDSILNTDSGQQIAEMNSKYESEKKDKELLKKDAQLSKQQSESRHQSIIITSAIAGIILGALLGLFILKGYREKRKTNIEISAQKAEIELKNKEIIDSIHYAKRIQGALLAGNKLLGDNLKEHFVLYKPKDIVSGDFYWAHAFGSKFLVCTADCTGHGVPGAFMSLLNISFLNEVTTEKKMTQPDKVLNYVRNSIIVTLNTEGNEESKDGMDCILCSIDTQQMKMEYAAANNSFYVVRRGELIIQPADKMPVGKSPRDHEAFTLRSFDLQKGDMIYTFTDGYADQFGGPRGKKFKYKQFEELLVANYQLPMNEQHKILNESIEQWKGTLEQVDDILIIGIRV